MGKFVKIKMAGDEPALAESMHKASSTKEEEVQPKEESPELSEEDVEPDTRNVFQKFADKFRKGKKIEDVLNDPDLLDVKNESVRSALDKTVRVVNSRMVRKTTGLAKNVLDITEKVKTGNILSTGAAAIASLELVADFFDIPHPDHFADFLEANELKEKRRGHLVEMILSPKILDTLVRRRIFESDESILIEVELGENNFVYMRQIDDSTDDDGGVKYYNQYYIKEDFDYEKAYAYFWDCFDNKIYLTNKGKSSYSEQLRLHTLIFDIEDLLIDEGELSRVGREINKCHEKDLSRSYLLVGPPGTGKSSFCFVASQKFCPRVLKVDPSVMHRMESGELEFFIEALKPNAVIFDDIDRCDTEGYLLFVLENLKRTFPNLVIFATANDFEALGSAIVRPGRFDRVIWVENPDEEARRTFITYYAPKFNLDIPQDLMNHTVTESEGFSQAYLIEMLKRASNDADIRVSFEGSSKEFKRTLEMESLEWGEEA
jgi:hypothetical protein